jgi:beta-lactamase superfamily II metal-dependent hydrolase
MHLTAFQSDKGDCLLLKNDAGTAHILVDGGMSVSYNAHVAAAMGKLRTAKKKLDVVYVSHIDQDHIAGVLKMFDDEAAWRVHLFQKAHSNPNSKPPKVPRPPEVLELWHNGFHDQVPMNGKPIADQLSATAPVLAGSKVPAVRAEALRQSELAQSIGEAIEVSRRISPGQLNIPLNPRADGKLMMLRQNQQPIEIGGLKFTIIGPTSGHLKTLRQEWNTWLESTEGKKRLKTINEAAVRDQERMGTSTEFDSLLKSLLVQAESFGDPDEVTTPNLASLTLLVEDATSSLLLTGDARGDQIVDGLEQAGRLVNGKFEVDVLKVPHHGSENNIDSDFVEAVIARDYVFCGNGSSGNPNHKVIEMMFRRRLAASPKPFKFWFNSSGAVSTNSDFMAQVETIVKGLKPLSHGRFTFKFLTAGSTITIL